MLLCMVLSLSLRFKWPEFRESSVERLWKVIHFKFCFGIWRLVMLGNLWVLRDWMSCFNGTLIKLSEKLCCKLPFSMHAWRITLRGFEGLLNFLDVVTVAL